MKKDISNPTVAQKLSSVPLESFVGTIPTKNPSEIEQLSSAEDSDETGEDQFSDGDEEEL